MSIRTYHAYRQSSPITMPADLIVVLHFLGNIFHIVKYEKRDDIKINYLMIHCIRGYFAGCILRESSVILIYIMP